MTRRDIYVPPPRPLEGDVLDNLPAVPRQKRTYDFTKEIVWTDEYFLQLDRDTVETIARLYREGRGTLVADEYRRTRTWLPNSVIQRKPALGEWAHAVRHKGKYRWLEISYTSAGGGYAVITLVYNDHSGPTRRKYRWFQSVLHHTLASGNWRKTVAAELRKMHRQALRERTAAIGYERKLLR